MLRFCRAAVFAAICAGLGSVAKDAEAAPLSILQYTYTGNTLELVNPLGLETFLAPTRPAFSFGFTIDETLLGHSVAGHELRVDSYSHGLDTSVTISGPGGSTGFVLPEAYAGVPALFLPDPGFHQQVMAYMGACTIGFDAAGGIAGHSCFNMLDFADRVNQRYTDTTGDRFVGNYEFQEYPDLGLMLGDTYAAAPGSWAMQIIAPVPLPASLGLMLAALGLLGRVGRRS